MNAYTQMSIEVDDDLTARAANIVYAVIGSNAYKEAWNTHYDSKIYSDHVLGAKQHLESYKQGSLNDREKALVVAFMRDVLRALQKASGQSYQPVIAALRDDLKATTGREAPSRLLMKNHKYKQMLEALEHDLMHDLFRPDKDVAKVGIHLFEELKEILSSKKKTAAFGLFVGITVRVGLFMHANIGGTTYTDPDTLGLMPDDIDADGNVRGDFTPLDIGDSQLSCHDHMKALVGENATIFLQDFDDNLVIEHCPQFMTFTRDAQLALNSSYDWYKGSVFDRFVTDVAQTSGHALSSADSFFRAGFEKGLETGAPVLYAINIAENAVIHPLVTCGTAALLLNAYFSRKQSTLLNEIENAVVDYIKRSYKTRPLKYIFGASAGVSAYMAAGEFGPLTVLSTFGGMVLGHYVQRAFNKNARKERVKQMINPDHADIRSSPYKPGNTSTYLAYGIPAALLAGALTQASIDPEFSTGFGEYTAYGLLGGFFVPFNVVEDSGQHGIFMIGGAALAASLILPHYAFKKAASITPETKAAYDYVSLCASYYKARGVQKVKNAYSTLPDMPGKKSLKSAWLKILGKKTQPGNHHFEYPIFDPD